jgi:hypothetical protein
VHAYIDGTGIAADPKGPLFRTIGRVTKQLTRTPLPQANAHAMRAISARSSNRAAGVAATAFTAMIYGYARVSTDAQDLISQLAQLKAAAASRDAMLAGKVRHPPFPGASALRIASAAGLSAARNSAGA